MEAATKRSHHAEKVSKHVPQHAPHGNVALSSPLSLRDCLVVWFVRLAAPVSLQYRNHAGNAGCSSQYNQRTDIIYVPSANMIYITPPHLLQQPPPHRLRLCLFPLALPLPLHPSLLHSSILHPHLTAISAWGKDGRSSLSTKKGTITPTSRSASPVMSRACAVGSHTMSSIIPLTMNPAAADHA